MDWVVLFFHKITALYVDHWVDILRSMLVSIFIVLGVYLLEAVTKTGWRRSGLRYLLDWRNNNIAHDMILFALNLTATVTIFSVLMSLGLPYLFSHIIKHSIQLDLGTHLPHWA